MALRRSRAPSTPKPPADKPGVSHYRTMLSGYLGRPPSALQLSEFASEVRANLTPDQIRNELIPFLPAASLGTTGITISRVKAALERVAGQ